MFPYLELYYCMPHTVPWVAPQLIQTGVTVAYAAWLVTLFSMLSLVASDFFCPNLSTLAGRFGLSDSVVGVTLLALGNGAPDVVSTFRAMEMRAGAMALGELVGAAVCTVAVVCGSIMVLYKFSVPPLMLFRDVGFSAMALLMVLYFLRDSNLNFAEGIYMLGLYVAYLLFVFLHDYWDARDVCTDEENTALCAPETPQPPPAETTPHFAHSSLLDAARVHDIAAHANPSSPTSASTAAHIMEHPYAAQIPCRSPSLPRSFSSTHLVRPGLPRHTTSHTLLKPHAPRMYGALAREPLPSPALSRSLGMLSPGTMSPEPPLASAPLDDAAHRRAPWRSPTRSSSMQRNAVSSPDVTVTAPSEVTVTPARSPSSLQPPMTAGEHDASSSTPLSPHNVSATAPTAPVASSAPSF